MRASIQCPSVKCTPLGLRRHVVEGCYSDPQGVNYCWLLTFFRCVSLGTPHSRVAIADASVVSCPWRRLRGAAPVTHQVQGLVTSRGCARHRPLAWCLPQNPLGALPGPSVDSGQSAWLSRAGPPCIRLTAEASPHEAKRGQAICARWSLGRIRWDGSHPTFPPASRLHPTAGPTAAQGWRRCRGHAVSPPVSTGP